MAEYGSDFYVGSPCLTRKINGKGEAWYVASLTDDAFLADLAAKLIDIKSIQVMVKDKPKELEITNRATENNNQFLFLLNHGQGTITFTIDQKERIDLLTGKSYSSKIVMQANEVLILS